MEATAAQEILHNQIENSSWVSPPIQISICKSLSTNNDTIDIDLTETIGKNNLRGKKVKQVKYYLPPEFSQNLEEYRSRVINPLITPAKMQKQRCTAKVGRKVVAK